MKLQSSILAAAFISLTAAPCSIAQQAEISMQFMTFPATMEPLRVELLLGEAKTLELLVPSNELGPTVKVPPMAALVFGETVLNAEQKPEFKVYGRGKPIVAPKQLVMLLRKGPDMASGFEVRCISNDVNAFVGGKILFVNAARIDVGGQMGNVKFALKPGAHTIVKPGLEPNGRLTHAQLFYKKEDKAVPFFSSMWPVAKEFRGLIFFYQDPNNANKIHIHGFRDFLVEE